MRRRAAPRPRALLLLTLLWTALAGCVLPSGPAARDGDGSEADVEWVGRSSGMVTLEFDRGVIEAPYGERAPFTVRVARGEVERIHARSQWVMLNGTMGTTTARVGDVFEGWIVAGAAPELELRVGDTTIHGPAVRALGNATIPARLLRDPVPVEALPAGLSYANGTVTYATPRVRESTGDPTLIPMSDWALVDGVLIGLVNVYTNDAVAPLQAPERPRLEVRTDLLPSGPLEVRAHVLRTCFCGLEPPTVEVLRVTLD